MCCVAVAAVVVDSDTAADFPKGCSCETAGFGRYLD